MANDYHYWEEATRTESTTYSIHATIFIPSIVFFALQTHYAVVASRDAFYKVETGGSVSSPSLKRHRKHRENSLNEAQEVRNKWV
jgi:hypothetical protein